MDNIKIIIYKFYQYWYMIIHDNSQNQLDVQIKKFIWYFWYLKLLKI